VKFAFEPADFQKTIYEDGWINDRMQINIEKRLLQLKLDMILEPFVHRPGAQWWISEHVGKYLHAASYAWLFTGDARLKKRMDYAVQKLIGNQIVQTVSNITSPVFVSSGTGSKSFYGVKGKDLAVTSVYEKDGQVRARGYKLPSDEKSKYRNWEIVNIPITRVKQD